MTRGDFLEGEDGNGLGTRRAARGGAAPRASLPTGAKDDLLRKVADGLDAAEMPSSKRTGRPRRPRPLFEEDPLAASAFERLKLDENKMRCNGRRCAGRGRAARPFGPRPLAHAPRRRPRPREGDLSSRRSPVIFESRPDAVTQIGSLALKSGNAAILKGGRESARSTAALLDVFARALAFFPEIPEGVLSSVAGRAEVDALLALDEHIDLVIPRGGYDLVRHVQAHTASRSSATRRASATSMSIARRTRRWRRRSSSTASSSTRRRATPPRRFSSTGTRRHASSSGC